MSGPFFRPLVAAMMITFSVGLLSAGEAAGPIPAAELAALDRAISRELNSSHLGSQTLGDLRRLRNRLRHIQSAGMAGRSEPPAEKQAALEPIRVDDSQTGVLDRLIREADSGDRAARRSLALYYLYLNDAEKALAQWRLMGRATTADLPYLIISAYLELGVGDYHAVRENLEEAMRAVDTRSSLALSAPVFCVNVGGYRIYTARSPGEVLPGEEVLIYLEVDGADFYPIEGGARECSLMFGLKLQDEERHTLWNEPRYGEYAPVFSGPVRDLHVALSWRVPNELRPGRYHLYVDTVEGRTKRRGESLISFNVGKRETHQEKRATSTYTPADIDKAMQEAGNTFYGGLRSGTENSPGGRLSEFEKNQRFEMQRNFERMQRPER